MPATLRHYAAPLHEVLSRTDIRAGL